MGQVNYIVVRDEGFRQVAFVDFVFTKKGRRVVVVTEDSSLKDAKIFNNECSAKGLACQLNNSKHHSELPWEAKEIKSEGENNV